VCVCVCVCLRPVCVLSVYSHSLLLAPHKRGADTRPTYLPSTNRVVALPSLRRAPPMSTPSTSGSRIYTPPCGARRSKHGCATSECVYVCVYVRMYVCVYVCVYVRVYVCMYVRMY